MTLFVNKFEKQIIFSFKKYIFFKYQSYILELQFLILKTMNSTHFTFLLDQLCCYCCNAAIDSDLSNLRNINTSEFSMLSPPKGTLGTHWHLV